MAAPLMMESASADGSPEVVPALGALPPLAPRVSLLYGGLYFHYGFVAFLPMWLAATGSSPAEIGTLMAIPMILRLLTVAPFAAWCGRHGQVRNAIAVTALIAALIACLLPIPGTYAGRVAVILFFSILWDQIPVLTDAYAVMAVRSQHLDFGRLRVWGSIGVVASNAVAGWAVGRFGITALPLLIAAMLLLPLLIAPLLPVDRRLMREPPEAGAGWRELFGDRMLMLALVVSSLIMGSHGVLLNFGAIQWSAAGISASAIGWLNAMSVASEIIAFVFGAKLLGQRDPRLLLLIAGLAAALRWMIMAISPAMPLLIFAQLLQGVSATGAILAPVLIIAARVPSRLASSAQGLNSVMLGAVLAGVVAGSGLLWRYGPASAYLAMAGLALASLPILLLSGRARAASDARGSDRS